ncbi:hypothetical protein [Tropicimonas isoalkanivorans]|uniref:Tat (Twin-arginine translocation) pathway signal sequence n=1 Tax=Tropicimonas isoalkanivorans TaxID=441112 RepID=A0A1I1P5N9_9RHOB|nr:hypothetical protein [Tropicimonas isoalkanivorans]SFD05254.1 hypothetical protein SAMN04488094_11416 [Tropicimonas isoalkanivorans]
MMPKFLTAMAVATVTTLGSSAAFAQDGGFGLELNNAREAENGCRMTYVARNGTGTDLSAISFEVAVFDAEDIVSRLLILEFGALTNGRTKVVQFDLADQPCEGISRLLVNSVSECSAAEGEAPDCMAVLNASSRTDIGFGL